MTRMGRPLYSKKPEKSVNGKTDAETAGRDSAVPSLDTRVSLEKQGVKQGNKCQSGDAGTDAGQDKLDGTSVGGNLSIEQTKNGSDMDGGNAGQKSRKKKQLTWFSTGLDD
jgi:hypothetical protein